MARGDVQVGKVVEYGDHSPRYKIDFGRRWAPRYLYSFRGARFESREMAEAILAHVHMEVSKGRALDDVLSELAPHQSATSGVEHLLKQWLDLFRKKVEAGDRQPRTLREYERWARPEPKDPKDPENHFAWWYGRSVWEVDEASLEEWSYSLAEKGLSSKTRRNVLAGFRSFLTWVARKHRSFTVPRFPWPTAPDHLPTVLTREVQAKVLDTIPELKRGVFIAMADLLIRPGEARVLRVRDWTEDELRVERAAKDRKLGGVIRGPKKATGVKTLPVSARLLDWLKAHVSAERRLAEPDGPLFSNPDGDSGWWSETSLRRTWGKACTRAGVAGIGLYEGTKHSGATHLKGLGADDRLLAAIMGHRDPRSVEKYAKVQGRAIRTALALLERADREPPTRTNEIQATPMVGTGVAMRLKGSAMADSDTATVDQLKRLRARASHAVIYQLAVGASSTGWSRAKVSRLGGLALVLTAVIIASCGDPRATVVPTDLKDWSDKPDLKAAIEKLPDDEKRLFVAFAMRRSISGAFGGEGIPPGTTVGAAIEAQRSWQAEQELEKQKQEELSKRLEAERVEALREMNKALTVTLARLEFEPSNVRAGRYSDEFSVEIGFENHTDRDMAGVKGVVVFKDVFGDPIKRVGLSSDETVPAGRINTWSGTLDYNQFMADDKKLRATDREKLKFEWVPDVYLFSDGTRLEMPSRGSD